MKLNNQIFYINLYKYIFFFKFFEDWYRFRIMVYRVSVIWVFSDSVTFRSVIDAEDQTTFNTTVAFKAESLFKYLVYCASRIFVLLNCLKNLGWNSSIFFGSSSVFTQVSNRHHCFYEKNVQCLITGWKVYHDCRSVLPSLSKLNLYGWPVEHNLR